MVSAAADETLRFWEIMGQPTGKPVSQSVRAVFKQHPYHLHIPPTPPPPKKKTDKRKEFMGNGVLLPPLNPAIMPRGASGFSAIR